MDEAVFGWLIEYEQELRQAGIYSEEEIWKLVLKAAK